MKRVIARLVLNATVFSVAVSVSNLAMAMTIALVKGGI